MDKNKINEYNVMPRLSVIVPIYNVSAFIGRCARSLFSQTLKDIEYIFVDDCSPDDSVSILQTILNDCPERINQVRIIRHDKNMGLAQARRTGFLAAESLYVAHCDSDDWVHPEMYERMLSYAEEGEFDMVWCDYYDSDGKNHYHCPQNCKSEKRVLLENYLSLGMMASIWNRVYKRDLQTLESFVYPAGDMTEDLVATVQLVLKSERIGYLPEPLYYYYYNSDSICRATSEKKVVKKYEEIIRNTEIVLSILEKAGLSSSLSESIVCKKFLCKEILVPLLKKAEYRKLWIDTYPEVNRIIRDNPIIDRKYKLKAFLILHHMYFLYAVLIRVIEKIESLHRDSYAKIN